MMADNIVEIREGVVLRNADSQERSHQQPQPSPRESAEHAPDGPLQVSTEASSGSPPTGRPIYTNKRNTQASVVFT
jgi:hypothetical protein